MAIRPTGHFDNRHSRWVARLKVGLPLLAVGILSTLFLIADRRGTGDDLPYSAVELDRIVGDGRVANPSYAGVGRDGAAVSLNATEGWPNSADGQSTAREISGAWESASGNIVSLSALNGRLDDASGTVFLDGDISVRDAQGYTLTGSTLRIDTASSDIASEDPVTGTGPPGRIEAGALSLTQQDGRAILTFTGGVNVLYDPASEAGD